MVRGKAGISSPVSPEPLGHIQAWPPRHWTKSAACGVLERDRRASKAFVTTCSA